jgi:hypothetical protein
MTTPGAEVSEKLSSVVRDSDPWRPLLSRDLSLSSVMATVPSFRTAPYRE